MPTDASVATSHKDHREIAHSFPGPQRQEIQPTGPPGFQPQKGLAWALVVDPSRQGVGHTRCHVGICRRKWDPATLSVGASHPSKGLGHMARWGIVGTGEQG